MEHAHPVSRPFSWRGAALAAALVLVIVLAGFGGMALLHRLGRTTPAPAAKHTAPAHRAVPLRPRSDISVLVLNGNGIDNAAGHLATRLLARGYVRAVPADAPSHVYARSIVLFRPGWGAEAHRLAQDVHARVAVPLDGRIAPMYAHDQLIVVVGG